MRSFSNLTAWLIAPAEWVQLILAHGGRKGVLLLLAILAGWYWYSNTSRKRPISVSSDYRSRLHALADEVPRTLPLRKVAWRPTLVLPLKDDPDSMVTDAICDALQRHGGYRPIDRSLRDRVIAQYFELVGTRSEHVADPQIAVRLAKNASADFVLMGQINQLDPLHTDAIVTFHLTALEVANGTVLLDAEFDNRRAAGGVHRANLRAWALGLILFAIWPVMTIPVMRRVLRMDSTTANVLAILIITAVPIFFCFLFLLTGIVAPFHWLALIPVAAATGLWTTFVMAWTASDKT
jgi:hypothetical protein